jgi:sensor histidine kinase YesM
LVLSFGTCIAVTQRWLSSEQNKKETENEKLNTELSFLKSQINPHFFFNTLNNIYSLAIVKSEQTAPAVMKLSSIMRYILSETEKDFVPLNNEIDFTKNYIELQQMRLTDKVTVVFNTSGVTDDLQIAPLLFIPFVENAFKYGVSTKEATTIDIQIHATNNQIEFNATNTVATNVSTHLDSTGIGINNAKRRLALLYPGSYQLNISNQDNTYQVSLKINS